MKIILDKNDKDLIKTTKSIVEDQIVGLFKNNDEMVGIVEKAMTRYIKRSDMNFKKLIKESIYELVADLKEDEYYGSGKVFTRKWIKTEIIKVIKSEIKTLLSKFTIKYGNKEEKMEWSRWGN